MADYQCLTNQDVHISIGTLIMYFTQKDEDLNCIQLQPYS
jgi:hypothetical protein